MPNIRLGIQTISLQQPLQKSLETAARLGAGAVELDARHEVPYHDFSRTALRQLRRMLEKLDLKVSAVRFLTRRGYCTSEALDDRVVATQAVMKFAYQLGSSVVVSHLGSLPEDEEGSDWDTLVDVLSVLGKYGNHVGSRLAAQTGGEEGSQLARLIGALPEGSVGVHLDPAALIINGYSPLEAVQALGPHILHVQANDAVRDLTRGHGLATVLGRGTADFPSLISALEAYTYRGWLTIERRDSNNRIGEIADAVEYLKRLQ